MANPTAKKSIETLGEFGLIEHLTGNFTLTQKSSVKGVGDDAAVMQFPDELVVVTTDLLTEGIHFNLMYVPLVHLGYKAVVVNLSDVYAMNAVPRQITVSIALSKRFDLTAVEQLYEGIRQACHHYGVDLIGGDTTSSLTGLTISITAIGSAPAASLVYRSGARPNDLLCVTGDLGGAYMGLQLLERENRVFSANPSAQPQLAGYDYILKRQLRPEARQDIVEAFRKMGMKPTSMIDISDGLSSEIMHLCKNSGVGCHLYEEKIPYHEETRRLAEEFNINPIVAALNGGEDYELLFTAELSDYEKIKNDPDITIIGHITEAAQGSMLVTGGGSAIPLTAQGWNPIGKE